MNNATFQRGMLLFQQGRYQEAVGELRLQLGQGVDDASIHYFLALSLSRLEQHAEATEHARQTIHLAPDQAFGHYALASVMIHRNRNREALDAILEAIRLNPYDADYFGILAGLYIDASRWRDALAAAEQGLAVEPEHNTCINMRAQALVNLGDHAAAAETMGAALARKPDDSLTHANQGWALLHQGNPKKALEHFREALRLNPELEWARAGIVQALKARNIVYRWMLAWFLWMSRLTPQARWGLVIGAFLGSRVIGGFAEASPQLAPYLRLLLYAYFGFVLMTWLSPSFFNLLLRLDRFGCYALSVDEIRGANLLAACLTVTIGFLAAGIGLGSIFLLLCSLNFALLALPTSAIYFCERGWPRTLMGIISGVLLAGVLTVVAAGLTPPGHRPAVLFAAAVALLDLLPWGMLASQFAANYLVGVKPKI